MSKVNMEDLIDEKWKWNLGNSEYERNEVSFGFALGKVFREVCYNCKKGGGTAKQYAASYNNIILPLLAERNKKMQDYTEEDYDWVIQRIEEQGYIKGGERHDYAVSTIQEFRRLIYYAVFYASNDGYCDNVLWGTRYGLPAPSSNSGFEERIKLKKSLSPVQDKKLAVKLLSSEDIPGEEIGVLLMDALGVRNAEAGALEFGDFQPVRNHPDMTIAVISKTIIPGTNKLQSSGKTKNAPRRIPVPQKVVEFVEKRKRLVRRELQEKGVSIDIDKLPIACRGYNYEERCYSYDITKAAKKLFIAVGVESKMLAYIDSELKQGNLAKIIREKNPTAYLLRRNYSTHLYLLGLDMQEIQYLMGHDIESVYEDRNDFSDSETLYDIGKKILKRPFFDECFVDQIEIDVPRDVKKKIRIQAREPGEKLEVSLKSQTGNQVKVEVIDSVAPCDYSSPKSVDIGTLYKKKYS